jgi:basic membrane protein A
MNKKIISMILMIILTASLILVGCGKNTSSEKNNSNAASDSSSSNEDSKKAKVGFIYVGPIGDGGWTYSHDEGRLYVEKELGVETIYKEAVPENQEVEKVLNDMIDQGATIIFATSFGYMDYVEKVAKEHPEVTFMHCSGYKGADNMSNYFGRMYEARYLSGIVAGLKTKTDKIGYVAAFEIPEVIRGINAFTLGVQSVNPDAKVTVRWTHTWYDPASEKDAADSLLDEGIDVIAQHQDTAGPQQAAEEKGAFSIGYNTDMKDKAPKAYMTAPIWNWGPYYTEQIKAVMDGTWKTDNYWGGLKDGIVDLAPLTDLAPENAKAKIEEAKKKILDDSLHVFAGPIKAQNGDLKVEEGKELTDEEMLSMDWFVEGVEGKIEGK